MENNFRRFKNLFLKLVFLLSIVIALCVFGGCGENIDENGRVTTGDELIDIDDNLSSGASNQKDITPWMTPLLLTSS